MVAYAFLVCVVSIKFKARFFEGLIKFVKNGYSRNLVAEILTTEAPPLSAITNFNGGLVLISGAFSVHHEKTVCW
jgi:hypothetical protein